MPKLQDGQNLSELVMGWLLLKIFAGILFSLALLVEIVAWIAIRNWLLADGEIDLGLLKIALILFIVSGVTGKVSIGLWKLESWWSNTRKDIW